MNDQIRREAQKALNMHDLGIDWRGQYRKVLALVEKYEKKQAFGDLIRSMMTHPVGEFEEGLKNGSAQSWADWMGHHVEKLKKGQRIEAKRDAVKHRMERRRNIAEGFHGA